MNTRSQGVTTAVASNSGDEDSTTDNSLMARRRRRRERAQTAYIMHAQTVDGIDTETPPAIVGSSNISAQRPIDVKSVFYLFLFKIIKRVFNVKKIPQRF